MPDGLGNEAQVRAVAQQLFDTWKTEQDLATQAKRRWFGNAAPGWIGVVVLLVGFIIGGAEIAKLANDADVRSQRNETAIAAMKAESSDRLARIETKIDLMMEDRRK